MIAYEDIQLFQETTEDLETFAKEVVDFRSEGPLDSVALAKLDEHFKVSHIYHSAGIEGNRLTLQETMLVITEGLDISGKPLKDSLEVKLLAKAFDYLKSLAEPEQTIREADIRSLHALLIGNDPELSPGEYRKVGVIISGSEHRPPEPLEVPSRMEGLIAWLNENAQKHPLIVSTVGHHELTAIHPFKDGNGRVSRLLMNLILVKHGFPICNIRREDRPDYYDALAFADVGLYDPLVKIVRARCGDLFSEFVRIRTETRRMEEWAARWGVKEAEVLRRREAREMELWQSRVRQVLLEFQKAAEVLNDKLDHLDIDFYDYKTDLTFDKYQRLLEEGAVEHSNAFSVSFREKTSGRFERFMFRYFRNWNKFSKRFRVIPLELNYFDQNAMTYTRLCDLPWASCIRPRELYFTQDGEVILRYFNIDSRQESERKGGTIAEAVQWFFDDVLRNVFHLK